MLIKLNLQRFAGPIPYNITVNGENVEIERSRDDIATTWEIEQSINSDKYSISNNKVVWNNGEILQYNNVDVLPTDEIISGTYTTRINTPIFKFKHWYANDIKIGTGTYKFKHWSAIKLIFFTISSESYQAIEGMTWQEWVNSSYNTGDYIVYNNNIAKQTTAASGARVTTDSSYNNPVMSSEIISATNYYYGQAN